MTLVVGKPYVRGPSLNPGLRAKLVKLENSPPSWTEGEVNFTLELCWGGSGGVQRAGKASYCPHADTGNREAQHSTFITCSVKKTTAKDGPSQPAAPLCTSMEMSSTSVVGTPWPATDFRKVLLAAATHVGPGAALTFQGRAEWPKRNHTAHKPGIPHVFPPCALHRRSSRVLPPGRNRTPRLL